MTPPGSCLPPLSRRLFIFSKNVLLCCQTQKQKSRREGAWPTPPGLDQLQHLVPRPSPPRPLATGVDQRSKITRARLGEEAGEDDDDDDDAPYVPQRQRGGFQYVMRYAQPRPLSPSLSCLPVCLRAHAHRGGFCQAGTALEEGACERPSISHPLGPGRRVQLKEAELGL